MKNKLKTVGFKPGERNIFFHILTACNLSCSHCYINPQQHGNKTLSKEQICNWLELFADPAKKSNVIFLGGEPTMHPDLPRAIKKAKELGYFVTVDTNGYLFHDLLKKTSPNYLDFLSFSLDGPDSEVNDPIRGAGVFDTCVENIKKAVNSGFSTSVIYTVNSKNIDHLERMIPLLIELKVKKFFIQVIGLRGVNLCADDAGKMQVSRGKWIEKVVPAAMSAAKEGIHVTYPKVFLQKDEPFECAGNVAENFFIFPNGRVYQCPLCEDHPIHSYQIKNDVLVRVKGLTESQFFALDIAEGCVMNKLLQPDTIEYDSYGRPKYKISCCLLKQEVGGGGL